MQNTPYEPKSNPTTPSQERLSIGNAAEYLGVSIDTLRRWEKKGSVAALRSPGGHRYFIRQDLDKLFGKKYTRSQPAQRIAKDEEQVQVQEQEKVVEAARPDYKEVAQHPIPAQDTPASFATTTYPSLSTIPSSGLEQSAKEIVKIEKPRNITWTKALVIGLIIFGVVDVILFILFLTSSRAPISPIP